MSNKPSSLEARLNEHPLLKARIEALLGVVENAAGDVTRADEAERQMIEELRRLGQEALQGWAVKQEAEQTKAVRGRAGAHVQGKKNSTGTRPSAKSR
jgi:hypothetical protein